MAKKTITSYVFTDDLTGEEVDEDNVHTIEFSYGGQDYTIDLSTKNADKLDELIRPYLDAGTKVRGSRGFKAQGKRGKVPSQDIRAWGRTLSEQDQKNLFPSDRGALRKEAIQAYNDVHGTSY